MRTGLGSKTGAPVKPLATLTAGLATAALLVAGGQGALAATGVHAADGGVDPSGVHAADGGIISAIAGGVGGPAKATTVALHGGCGANFGGGSLYVADNDVVRQVNPVTDRLTSPAGIGFHTGLGNNGLATLASLRGTCGTAVDPSGNLLLADGGGAPVGGNVGAQVRVVAAHSGTFYGRTMKAGRIYVLAGTGKLGFHGDGGPAARAKLSSPFGVTVDGSGNVVIADSGNDRIRVVAATTGTFYGQAMTADDIYTVAGSGRRGFSGDGGPATGAKLAVPSGVAVDGTGNLVIADDFNNRIRVVAATTGTFYGQAMTAHDIYTVAGNGTGGYSGDSGPATSAELNSAISTAIDGAGNLVIADDFNNRIRVVAATTGTFYGQAMTAHDIYTVAGDGTQGYSGDGGPATSAELNGPDGVTLDGAGNLVIADRSSDRTRVVAAKTGTFYGQTMTANHIYTVAGNGSTSYSGDGGPAKAAELSPWGLGVDGGGNVLIPDGVVNNVVRVVAKTAGTFYGQTMTANHIYAVAGNGTGGYSGDGGPATSAELSTPYGATVDHTGNLVISDFGNNRVRVVAVKTGTFYGQAMTADHIYTVAGDGTFGFSGDGGPATSAKIGRPLQVAVDPAGNLVLPDWFNSRIRVIAVTTGTFYGQAMKAGDIYTVAGGGTDESDGVPALTADLEDVMGAAVDASGNLVIGDSHTNRLRVVPVKTGTFYGQQMTADHIYTVAGGGSGDAFGVPATSVQLFGAGAVTSDSAGNLIFIDGFGFGLVTLVAARAGTFYGQQMTVGDIYLVAGGGSQLGNGGQAAKAQVSASGVAVNSAGDLLIADGNRIRAVTN